MFFSKNKRLAYSTKLTMIHIIVRFNSYHCIQTMSDNIHQNFKDALSTRTSTSESLEILDSIRKPLKKSIFINNHKISTKDFENITKPWWWLLTTPTWYNSHEQKTSWWRYIDRENLDLALGNTFLHQAWYFYIQEIAASNSAINIEFGKNDIVLDMAAAPGGKTSQLANGLLKYAYTHDCEPGLVVANDINSKRIPQLAHNVNRWGYYNTAITKVNGFSFGKNLPNFFDHVLLDAPCSWEWTWFKSDSALVHWKQEEINKIAWTQFQLVVSAIKTCKTGGTIIYSTCTLNPYENELLIEKVLEFFADTVEIIDLQVSTWSCGLEFEWIDTNRAKKYARCRPHKQKTGGFFIVKMRKTKETQFSSDLKHTHKLLPRNQFKLNSSKKLQQEVNTYIKKRFGIELDPIKHFIVATKEKVYLCSPTAKSILSHLHLEKIGIPILKTDRFTQFRPTHYLGNILGHLAHKNTIGISAEAAQQYAQNQNISLVDMWITHEQWDYPYRILTRNNTGFSLAKIVKGELKNKFCK